MAEVWKQSSADAGYEVSSEGRIRSKDRMVAQRGCGRASAYERILPGRTIKPFISKKTGYLQVNLSKKARHAVHRLIAAEFCDGYSDGLVVNHKNGIRADNRAENLEWVTASENVRHSFSELGRDRKQRPLVATDATTGAETFFSSGIEAGLCGFSRSAISNCCNGKARVHKGMFWRFADESGASA